MSTSAHRIKDHVSFCSPISKFTRVSFNRMPVAFPRVHVSPHTEPVHIRAFGEYAIHSESTYGTSRTVIDAYFGFDNKFSSVPYSFLSLLLVIKYFGVL